MAISYLDGTTVLGEVQWQGGTGLNIQPFSIDTRPPLVPSCVKQSCTTLTPLRGPKTVVQALCLRFKGTCKLASDGSGGSERLGASKPHVISICVIYCLRKAQGGQDTLSVTPTIRQQKDECDSFLSNIISAGLDTVFVKIFKSNFLFIKLYCMLQYWNREWVP